jgi:hypothetical protein
MEKIKKRVSRSLSRSPAQQVIFFSFTPMTLWHVILANNVERERDVVLVPLVHEDGRVSTEQAFYLSSGISSARAGTWLPFHGIVDCLVWSSNSQSWSLRKWYDKRAFAGTEQLALERFGHVDVARASWRMGGGIWATRKGETIARALHLDMDERGIDTDRLVYPGNPRHRELDVADDYYDDYDTEEELEEEEEEEEEAADENAYQRQINALVNSTLEDVRITSKPHGHVSAILLDLVVQRNDHEHFTEQDRAKGQMLCDALETGNKHIINHAATDYRAYFHSRAKEEAKSLSRFNNDEDDTNSP